VSDPTFMALSEEEANASAIPPGVPLSTPEIAPTAEEIARVRRYECSMNGHSWDVVEQFGGPPVSIHCTHCGESHKVVA
jgi:hypothetical protein